MKQASENHFNQGKVGESLEIKIPDVEIACSDFRNIIGVILYDIFTKDTYLNLVCTVLKTNFLRVYFYSQ